LTLVRVALVSSFMGLLRSLISGVFWVRTAQKLRVRSPPRKIQSGDSRRTPKCRGRSGVRRESPLWMSFFPFSLCSVSPRQVSRRKKKTPACGGCRFRPVSRGIALSHGPRRPPPRGAKNQSNRKEGKDGGGNAGGVPGGRNEAREIALHVTHGGIVRSRPRSRQQQEQENRDPRRIVMEQGERNNASSLFRSPGSVPRRRRRCPTASAWPLRCRRG
jgi:hypothetical protein